MTMWRLWLICTCTLIQPFYSCFILDTHYMAEKISYVSYLFTMIEVGVLNYRENTQ